MQTLELSNPGHVRRNSPALIILALAVLLALVATPAPRADSVATLEVTEYENLAYGPVEPGNLLDLYIPDLPSKHRLPLIIWHSGSAWFSNTAKDSDGAVAIAEEFTARGYAVATISIRSSIDARFPAQGYDVRAAIRWLREHAKEYGINSHKFAFMGNSSGGWAAAFAATTSDMHRLPGETGVRRTSSAVQVAVPFFPPTDFLSMDTFAADNNLPMGFAYPHDSPLSPEGFLIQCPGEPNPIFPPTPDLNPDLVSIQDCPDETEEADPTSYIRGREVPMWLFHGGQDPLLPFNQSELVYDATRRWGNQVRYTFVPAAVHDVNTIIGAEEFTTKTSLFRRERVDGDLAPTWDNIEEFIRKNLR
jgi:acetyl esterase/lipase